MDQITCLHRQHHISYSVWYSFRVPFWYVFLLTSAVSVPVSCLFGDIQCGITLHTRTRLLLVQCIYFIYGTVRVRFPTPGTQEPVIFENMSRGSRAQPAQEDNCCHRRGVHGSALAGGLCRDDMDQLSQLMLAKLAVGTTVTLWQLILDLGYKCLFLGWTNSSSTFGFGLGREYF